MRLFFLPLFLLNFLGCKDSKTTAHPPINTTAENKTELSPSDTLEDELVSEVSNPILGPQAPFGAFGVGQGGRGHNRRDRNEYIHFVPNSHDFWSDPDHATTYLLEDCTGSDCECTPGEEGCQALPAYANILLDESNFVWCKGGPYALCYYSGPSDGSIDLSCSISEDGRFADCKCFEIPYGTYFVDINAILNYEIYQDTIQACGADGSGCSGSENINKAPVCEAINRNNFIPEAELVSTFSLDCVPTDGIGQTACAPNLYAGCMTAPCRRTETEGIVECSCPLFDGPFQVGTTLVNPTEECVLGDNLVWSAAFSPTVPTLPPLSPCIPDAPGSNGCPLYNNTMTVPPGTDCLAVCEAYNCMNGAGIQAAYTCDATLCTGECNERQLLEDACQGLAECSPLGLAAIIKLESEVECSCCASQLCGCTPNDRTNNAIFNLNRRQRNLSIIPQCDVNGTLCGIENPVSAQ